MRVDRENEGKARGEKGKRREARKGEGRDNRDGRKGGGLFYKLISFPIVVWEVFREIPEEIYLVQM